MEKEFTNVEELDKFFESNKVEEPKVEEPKVEEPKVDETIVEPSDVPELEPDEELDNNSSDDEEDESDSQVDSEEELESKSKSKPSKEEKRDYAFSKLRKEASEAKRALEEQTTLVQRLMKEAGYSNYDDFKEALNKQFTEKEMKEKGYTKEQFNEVEQLRQRTKELEEVIANNEKKALAVKAQNFDTMVKTYASQAKITSNEVYETLGKAGYTAELLLNLPNPEILIRGILADKVKPVEKPIKKTVDTEKLPSGGTRTGEFNLDDLLKAELDAYQARKGKA